MLEELKIPMGVSNWRNHGIKYHYTNFFNNKLIKKIEQAREETQKETGSFKYDFVYNEIIEIIKNETNNKKTKL